MMYSAEEGIQTVTTSIYVVTSITCGYIRQMMYPAEEGIQTVTTSIYVVISITCGYIRQLLSQEE